MNIAEKAKRERRSKYVILDKYLHWRMKTGSVPTSFSSVRVNVFFWHVFPQYWSRIHCPLCVSVSIENVFSLLFLEIPENEMKNVCCFFSLVCSLFSSSIARKYYQYSTYENKTHTFCKNMWRWWHYGTQQSIVSIDCYHILFWFWFLLPIMDLFVIIFFTSTFFYATNGVFSAAPIRRSEVYSFNLKCCDTQLYLHCVLIPFQFADAFAITTGTFCDAHSIVCRMFPSDRCFTVGKTSTWKALQKLWSGNCALRMKISYWSRSYLLTCYWECTIIVLSGRMEQKWQTFFSHL